MSQRSTTQHCQIDTPFCTICKSHVTWNFAVPAPHGEEIRCCTLLFLSTLDDILTDISFCWSRNETSSFGNSTEPLCFDKLLFFCSKFYRQKVTADSASELFWPVGPHQCSAGSVASWAREFMPSLDALHLCDKCKTPCHSTVLNSPCDSNGMYRAECSTGMQAHSTWELYV